MLHEIGATLIRLFIGLIFAGIAWLVAREMIYKMASDMTATIQTHTEKAEQGAAANP